MKFNLIDIHCHLDFPDFDGDRDEIIKNTLAEKVGMITIGATKDGSSEAVRIAEKHEGVWASVGVHPHDAEKPFDENYFRELARRPKVVAIGECGLDFYKIQNSKFKIKEQQKEIFIKQIELALEVDKPLMIHCRDAHSEVLEILRSYFSDIKSRANGDIHFFAGGTKEAEEYMELGFSFSFTGVITFANQYDEIIKKLPLEKIMTETDAPFVAPVPYRGRRCEPLHVKEVAKRIAEIRGISYEEVAAKTKENATKLFHLEIFNGIG